MEMDEETRLMNEKGKDKEIRNGNGMDMGQSRKNPMKDYLKEATVTVDTSNVNARAEDIITAVTEIIGVGKILAVRPKQNKEYEVTLENVEDVDSLMDGLGIKGMTCEVKKLINKHCVVSFMHLPAYISDQKILEKLEGWGVIPISAIKRRLYPGTTIEDGTRFVKTKFPKEVTSLPYSTKFDTAEGLQYFRVMHSHQVKTCRLCMCPDHIVKDCPAFKCYICDERGHFGRDCTAVRCTDCKKALNKCECWFENDDEICAGEQVHGRENVIEPETLSSKEIRIDETAEYNDNVEQTEEQHEHLHQQPDVEVGTVTEKTPENTMDVLDKEEEGSERQRMELKELEEQSAQESQLELLIAPTAIDGGLDGDEGPNSDKEENAGLSAKIYKRRRQLKVKPSLKGIRRKSFLKNRYDCLEDTGDMS